MDPQLYQALQATSPFASPRPIAWQSAIPYQCATQRSLVGQREWMYLQMREAAQSMRRDGINLPIANWTPPWGYVPDPSPSPDNPNRFGYVPAFFSHQTCDPTVADRPKAAPMDYPLFPDYHAR
eukprot:9302455-Pyramimonas_sp.AAC.1